MRNGTSIQRRAIQFHPRMGIERATLTAHPDPDRRQQAVPAQEEMEQQRLSEAGRVDQSVLSRHRCEPGEAECGLQFGRCGATARGRAAETLDDAFCP